MSEIEINDWLEAARIKKISDQRDFLELLPFSNIQTKKQAALYGTKMRKMWYKIKIPLGIQEQVDKKQIEAARKAKQEVSKKLHVGRRPELETDKIEE